MQQTKHGSIKINHFDRSINIFLKTLHRSLCSLLLAAWFVLPVCSTGLGDSTEPNIQPRPAEQYAARVLVEHSDLENATTYSVSREDCTIKWIARNSEIGVIKHCQCAAPLAEQLPLLIMICAEFFGSDKNAQAFRTLHWGRLAPDVTKPGLQEMSLRLTLAAHKSPGWDLKRGKPKNGDINGFVKDLANRENIYPELKELFERFHRSIKFSCAEKVLVQKAEKLPFFEHLKKKGIKGSDKLPFDCMTWFSISADPQK